MSSSRAVGLTLPLAVCVAYVLAACAITPEQDAARVEAEARLNAEISVRQGPAVSRICPRNSDGWEALGDDVLLLEASGGWYMAELAGTCNPGSAFAVLATRTGAASSCLRRGDDIFTGRPRRGQRCVITALYEWNQDAEVEPAASADTVEK